MIEFKGTYISAGQVDYVCVGNSGKTDYPFRLTVVLRNERQIYCDFKTQEGLCNERSRIVRQIESEVRRDDEMQKILNRLYLIEGSVKRIDKRQLRVWRQLRKLLNIEEEAESE